MKNDFAIINKLGYTTHNGLCVSLDDAKNNTERLYLDEALKLGVNAVFFRRFYKETETHEIPFHSEPAVCIFNITESFFNSQEHKELHAALWSQGKVEIYILQSSTRIDIINARKPAKRISNEDLEIDKDDEKLLLVSEALRKFDDHRFSAHLFGSGTFWEQSDFIEAIDGNSSPYIYLLDYLMQVRKMLSESQELNIKASTLDKLLVVCILVKFLEEIKDDNGKHTLGKIYKTYKIKDFAEALEQKLCVQILNRLSTEFNGKIFDTFSNDEKNKLQKADLTLISQFLRANINLRTKQYFIWEQFSFKHLPAEVISAIYENFIQAEALRKKGVTEKGVVYTPIHLVNLLVDEVMPLEQPELFSNNTFKVLDPTCGSGVFLVAVYKRMLQWWTINNSKNGRIKYPNKRIAQKILEDNIFGVDTEETATLVSIFGLTTALLDKLTPKEIWDNLKFKDLKGRNIREESFFSWAHANKNSEKEFDLVIGNPPFNPPSGVSKTDVVTDEELSLFNVQSKDIPNNNLALKFLEGALFFGKKTCLIIPANVILYNKSSSAQKYRTRLFSDFTVLKIYDFTHLRRSLFHRTADTPVVAFILKNQSSSNHNSIEHIVVKRELLSERKIRFEIDYYDRHQVLWNWATSTDKQFIWKTNLLGGGRLFNLIYKLSSFESLKDLIDVKKKENPEWAYEVGYETGNTKSKEVINYLHKQDKVTHIDKSGEVHSDEIEETKFFYRPKTSKLFCLPLLIMHKKIGNEFLPIGLKENHNRKYLVFNNSFVGIHAPKEDYNILQSIYSHIKKHQQTYIFWILATSSSSMVYQETAITKSELDSLPFPKFGDGKDINLSESEISLREDILKYYVHLGKAISKKGAGNILHEPINEKELIMFGNTFCNALNEIYAKNGRSWQMGQVIQSPTFVRFQIGFGKNKGLKFGYSQNSQEEYLSLLEDTKKNSGTIHKRIIRFYNHEKGYDCIYLIKPQTKKYWLKSIALRDADDTFVDLKKAGF